MATTGAGNHSLTNEQEGEAEDLSAVETLVLGIFRVEGLGSLIVEI